MLAMGIDEILTAARSRITRVEVDELSEMLLDGVVVIDVRDSASRRATGIIPGSIPIGRSVLEWRCDPASASRDDRVAHPDAQVIIVCDQGYSSSLAADSLRLLGFTRVGDLVGGVEAWSAAGLPLDSVG